jgi:DNA-directed RNA polymerase subunit alpha
MSIVLGRMEMPNKVVKDDSTVTATYAKFIAEPFEKGYGVTIGNAMRRVLLSSIEAASVTSIRIEDVFHEFGSIQGVLEDVPTILLNVKEVLFVSHTREPKKVEIRVEKKGPVTAGDIICDSTIEILNPDHVICTLSESKKFIAEMEIGIGRGYVPAEKNKKPDSAIGTLFLSSAFSPVRRVKYCVENTRIGQMTDYDKLILEIWTDLRIEPNEALKMASTILKKHLNCFVDYDESFVEFERKEEIHEQPDQEIERVISMPISEIELSVRSANCIAGTDAKSIGDLAQKTEQEMLRYRNFGKKSLNEIKAVLAELGLTLGMSMDEIRKSIKVNKGKK